MAKTWAYQREQRARLLQHNHLFVDSVVDARQRLGLPPPGIPHIGAAIQWRLTHTGDNNPYNADLAGGRSDGDWEFLRLQEMWTFDPKRTDVPLYREASTLVAIYLLPEWTFYPIVWFILANRWFFLRPSGVLGYPGRSNSPVVEPVRVDRQNNGEVWVSVRIDEYTRKADVDSLWSAIRAARDDLRAHTGVNPPNRRTGSSLIDERRRQRDIEWYRLYRELGSVSKVVDRLQKIHPDDCPIPEETIQSSIRRTERLLKPRV